jgi:hypothetical protein
MRAFARARAPGLTPRQFIDKPNEWWGFQEMRNVQAFPVIAEVDGRDEKKLDLGQGVWIMAGVLPGKG